MSILLFVLAPVKGGAEEYVLPGSWKFYDANGHPLREVKNPTIEMNSKWMGSWALIKQMQPTKTINKQVYNVLTLNDGNQVLVQSHELNDSIIPIEKKYYKAEAESTPICLSCAQDALSRTKRAIDEATEKLRAQLPPPPEDLPTPYKLRDIDIKKYRSLKKPNYGGWGRCANIIKSDGSLGPWGQVAVESMKKHQYAFSNSNPGMKTVCPNFETFNEEEKFDYYLWTIMALMAEESDCNPNAESPTHKDGVCFNPSCTSAHGLCQLPQGWGNMKNPISNTKACVKTFYETIIDKGSDGKLSHIGVSSDVGSGENHFGPHNIEAHLWKTYKPKLHHYMGQWTDKCGPFPKSREVYYQLMKEQKAQK